MFIQAWGRGKLCGHISTPGSNLTKGYPVTGRYGQLYRYARWFACHCYGNFDYQLPDKQPTAMNL